MAGRIPQAFLDTLLDRLDIVEVVDRRVKLKKTGKNYSARCPFHDEKTPSFSVNPDKQFYYCFGCGAGGNALGFVMDYENLEFPQAVETLASSVGLDVPREETRPGGNAYKEDNRNRELYALMEKAASYYQHELRKHPRAGRAVDYLKARGLTGEIASQFALGFAPPGWDNLIKALADGEEQKKLLIDAGMLVENESGRVYDRFRDRVVFPIRDQRGRVIAFGGRVLGDDKPKYLNSPETSIFHKGRELYGLYQAKQANRKLERILVVEGYMDVIALAQHGINNATATLGTSTSKTHLERIYRVCSEVLFCFDGDDAGRKAGVRAMEAALPCMEDGRQARFLFLPEGEDPDTIVRSGGKEGFEQLMAAATPLETFLFEFLAEGIDLGSMDGRARLSKLALPYIRQLPEGVYRQLMFNSLADRTGLEVSSLMQLEANTKPASPREPAQAVSPPQDQGPPPAAPADYGQGYDADYDPGYDVETMSGQSPESAGPRSRPRLAPGKHQQSYSNFAQAAIALLLHKPQIAGLIERKVLEEIEGDDIRLLRELLDLLRLRPESNTAMLLGHWYDTPEGELLSRLAGQERLIPTEGIEAEFVDTIGTLADLPQQSKLDAQVDKLKLTNYAEMSEQDKQRLKDLLKQKQERDARRKNRQ